MTVATTSAQAYRSLGAATYLQPKQTEIMAAFLPGLLWTRQQLSRITAMPINAVCGRVNSLVAAGLLEEHGTRLDPSTGKHQKLLRLPVVDGLF